MRKVLKNLVVFATILMVIGISPIYVGVEATTTIANEVNATATTEENVEMKASIGGKFNVEANVEEEIPLDFSIKVSNTGYLKDIVVSLDNCNFSIKEDSGKNVKSVKDTKISLSEVNSGETLDAGVKVYLPKAEIVDTDLFDKESTISINAVYVNEVGNEKEISKEFKLNVKWNATANETVSQELTRYIEYNTNNTLVSFKVKDGIENNIVPALNKKITINAPKIDGKNPINAIVIGGNTEKEYKDGVLTITKQKEISGKVVWDSQDEYTVLFIYDARTSEESLNITTSATVTTINGKTVSANTENNSFEITSQVGAIIDLESVTADEISKGYMVTNLNRQDNKLDTDFKVSYKVNVGLAELVDRIVLTENENYLSDTEASSFIFTKKVSISADNLTSILGEDGTVTIKYANNEIIDTLNKDKTEIEVNTNNIIIETSKPVTEGNLNIEVNKVIGTNLEFNRDQINALESLKSIVTIDGIKEDTTISNKQIEKTIRLTNTTSKALISLSQKELSTIAENKELIMNIVLKTNEISDTLYTSPIIGIELPSQVTSINITDAKLIYGNEELVPASISTEGNRIIANIDGIQTQYADKSTSVGPIIRLVANVTLDNLAPSSTEKARLVVLNQETGEEVIQESEINVVAPEGFITTNSITANGETAVAINENKQILIDKNIDNKEITISSVIVNNLGETAKGFTVVGRIPSKGNKSIQEEGDLGSNINTRLNGLVNVDGIDAKVYYSENESEKIDGNWNENYSADAKSYKIVADSDIEDKTRINVSYNVVLPETIYNGIATRAIYGVYYNNDAKEGQKQNLLQSMAVGVYTEGTPELQETVLAYDTQTGEEIQNDGQVKENEYITYEVNVKNTGDALLNNVNVTAYLPEGLNKIEYYDLEAKPDDVNIFYTYSTTKEKEIAKTISEILPGESKKVKFNVVVEQNVEYSQDEALNLQTKFKITADNVLERESTFNVKNSDEYFHVNILSSDVWETNEVCINDDVYMIAEVTNVDGSDKENVVLNIQLPKGLEYKDILEGYITSEGITGKNANYDANSNVVSVNIGNMTAYEVKRVEFISNVKVRNDNMKLSATVNAKDVKDVRSNTVTFNAQSIDSFVKAVQTTNIVDGSLTDTDNVEFYIDIENKSEDNRLLRLTDSIPEGLSMVSYSLVVDGNTVQDDATRYIESVFTLGAGKTARATIVAKANSVAKDQINTINNEPTIVDQSGRNVDINNLELDIIGTNIYEVEEVSYEEIVEEQTREGVFRLVGTVWEDTNIDGKKDETEPKLSNIQVALVNSSNEYIAQDVDGNNLITTTDENGVYTFEGIKKGNYIVLVSYDTETYKVTAYKAEGITDAENSDFIDAETAGKTVAITDVITIEDNNVYNINLGLENRNRFDLSVEQSIKRITDVNSKKETRIYDYNSNLAKIELSNKDVEYSTILVEYSIKIKNEGTVAGYARSIIDYIPAGMEFNSELNPDWFIGQDGNGHNTRIANTLLNPGETEEVTLILTKQITGENVGTTRNTVEVETYYNELGLTDIDSKSANKVDGEDDISGTDMIVLMTTGKEAVSIIGITLGSLTLVALAVFVINKYVINKMYNNVI